MTLTSHFRTFRTFRKGGAENFIPSDQPFTHFPHFPHHFTPPARKRRDHLEADSLSSVVASLPEGWKTGPRRQSPANTAAVIW